MVGYIDIRIRRWINYFSRESININKSQLLDKKQNNFLNHNFRESEFNEFEPGLKSAKKPGLIERRLKS